MIARVGQNKNLVTMLKPMFGEIPADTPDFQAAAPTARSIAELEDALVWPQSGLIRTKDGALNFQPIWVPENLPYCGDYDSWASWFPKHRSGRYFNLSLLWWRNYYHWICDVLPRLQGITWADDIRFIVPENIAEWQVKTLRILGLNPDRFEYFGGRRPVRVNKLLHVPPVIMTGNVERCSITAVRDSIVVALNRGGPVVSRRRRRIYVSRRNAAMRRIVNEAELMPLLIRLGFEILETENLSFQEQVQIFYEAEIIVGPHGAGLTNMLWCSTPAVCLELFEPSAVRICYWSLAKALQHRYFCGVGEARPGRESENDMFVEPRLFHDALSHIVAQI